MDVKASKSADKGRRYNSTRNLIWGVGSQIVVSAVRFLIRTVMVRSLGLEYVSLNGLFTEIIAMLTLSELGIGAAITYSMYKPLAVGDEDRICRLMTMYKKAYRVIAAAIMGIGLILTPFIPGMVADIGFPEGYIRLVFMLFVVKTASSYLYSYKSGILSADQRMYVVTSVQSLFSVAASLASLAILILTKEFVAYLAVQIVFTMAGNFAISRKADREYPYIKKNLPLPKDESKALFKDIGSIFVGRMSGKITNSTDNILITMLVSTLSVGLYSNYSMILGVLTGFLTQFQSAVSASLGNMFATQDDSRCERTLDYLTFLMVFVGCVCASCFYCVMTPLVSAWLGPKYVIEESVLFVLSLNLFFATAHAPLWTAMSSAGLFKYDKYTSMAGSLVNLVASVILGKMYGMLGIFIGTTLTHIIQLVSKDALLYKLRFKMPSVKSLMSWAMYTALSLAAMLLSRFVCGYLPHMNAILGLALRTVISAGVTLAILVPIFARTSNFKRLISAAKRLFAKLRGRAKTA